MYLSHSTLLLSNSSYFCFENSLKIDYETSSCPLLELWCSKSSYQLRFSLWYTSHFTDQVSLVKNNERMHKVLNLLENLNSIPFVIRENLSLLDDSILFKWLEAYPMSSKDVRSKNMHGYDIMFLHVFYVIKNALFIVKKFLCEDIEGQEEEIEERVSNRIQETLRTFTESTDRHLSSIINLRMKFIALQYLFQSIFIKKNYLSSNFTPCNKFEGTSSSLHKASSSYQQHYTSHIKDEGSIIHPDNHLTSLELINCILNLIERNFPNEGILEKLKVNNESDSLYRDFTSLLLFTKEGIMRCNIISKCISHFRRLVLISFLSCQV